jgi:hypothetical protein
MHDLGLSTLAPAANAGLGADARVLQALKAVGPITNNN